MRRDQQALADDEEARTIFPVHVHRRVPSRPTLRFAVVVQI